LRRLTAFDYHEPATLDDAIAMLDGAGANAHVLAGGTDLLVDIKIERIPVSTVINIKGIAGLSGIEATAEGTRIGALTKATEVQASDLVGRRHPGLAQAAAILASPSVRALATIGGNVGRASPASDFGPALIVHRAQTEIVGADGVRRVPVEELYLGPGLTSLATSDIITAFLIPDPAPGFGSAHIKVGKRGSGTDIAIAAVSASVTFDAEGLVGDCRVALASLAPRPLRSPAVEAAVRGTTGSEDELSRAAIAVRNDINPIDDVRATASYRKHIAGVLTLRALRRAVAAARNEVGG